MTWINCSWFRIWGSSSATFRCLSPTWNQKRKVTRMTLTMRSRPLWVMQPSSSWNFNSRGWRTCVIAIWISIKLWGDMKKLKLLTICIQIAVTTASSFRMMRPIADGLPILSNLPRVMSEHASDAPASSLSVSGQLSLNRCISKK